MSVHQGISSRNVLRMSVMLIVFAVHMIHSVDVPLTEAEKEFHAELLQASVAIQAPAPLVDIHLV